MLVNKLHIFFQQIAPQHLLTRIIGKLAECRWHWWKNLFIKKFIKMYAVDMNEATERDPTKYENFNAFFTRALNPEARPIVEAPHQIACPADGFISEIGHIQDNIIFQAKNFHYDLKSLLGGSDRLAKQFQHGEFATIYLAPKNYHRVHTPMACILQQMIYVPGQLFSVNQNTVNHVPNLFARNERVISIFETSAGSMAVIMVGAMIVGSIETIWAGTIVPSSKRQLQKWEYEPNQVVLNKGDELGRFKLGSTVIILMSKDRVSWENLKPMAPVKMGQFLGSVHSTMQDISH